jgi:sugar lactone lactonase YvrE
MAQILDSAALRVFFDGIFCEPRLAHPEGIAVHEDGSVWCGTETGHLIRVEPDGSDMRSLGCTDGFLLGMAFDADGNCYACDLRHSAVYRYDISTSQLSKFASSGIRVPNFPVVDDRKGVLYVSDSNPVDGGGGIYRYDLETGRGDVWHHDKMAFANGMAMASDGSGLFVVESDAACVSFVPINPDGTAGEVRVAVAGVDNVPDGVVLIKDGSLLISCYEPSRIYHYSEQRGLRILIEDPRATVLAHPTNIALRGNDLLTANLGRWHLSIIDIGALLAEAA